MPLPGDEGRIFYSYRPSKEGIKFNNSPLELYEAECLYAQNLVYNRGMRTRDGQSLLTSLEVVADKKIQGLHRFYKADGTTKQLLAACDTVVKYWDGSAWASAIAGLTTGYMTHMTTWGGKNKVYICNGIDAMRSWDGATPATLTLTDGVPTQALPYLDRLLTIIGGNLTWSASFNDTAASWETASVCGVTPDTKLYGMCYHVVNGQDSGLKTKVLLAGANGMYVFFATDMSTTTRDFSIYQISTVGCTAPKTMCWTPAGTMWLGMDRQVYLLPFNSAQAVPISAKIHSLSSAIEGIEKLPANQIQNACAVYHKGYYKLSFAGANQTKNNVQFWLDVSRLYKDEDGQYGPWYGPMVGQAISCFATQNGFGDEGELMAGESSAKGYVYHVSDPSANTDIDVTTGAAKNIAIVYQTFNNPLGNPYLMKEVDQLEVQLSTVNNTITIEFHDVTGAVRIGDTLSVSSTAGAFWNDEYWNDFYWSANTLVLDVKNLSDIFKVRRLSVIFKHEGAEDFELYDLCVLAREGALEFETLT